MEELDLHGKLIGDFLIPAEKVAHVQVSNSLEHAMLVLVATGYSAVPALDPAYKLCGLVSTSMILQSITGLERMEYEKLDQMKVEEVISSDIPTLHVTDSLAKGLELAINHPFVCVEDDSGYFAGIFTRRVLLKQMKRMSLLLDNMEIS